MTIFRESFIDIQNKYNKVKKLIEEDCKTDPENEPYLSKYTARELLLTMKANIDNLLRNCIVGTKEHLRLTGMLAATYLYMGMIAVDTEELSAGEKSLIQCQEIVDKYEAEPEIILVSLNMLNQFGILWSQRDPKKSKLYLEKAISLYNNFKQKALTPYDIDDLFKLNVESSETGVQSLEKVYTLTLYYVAQIYGSLNDALKSAIYCHITLKRQLESGNYDSIDWALNAATLSQFFMERNGFKEARHHLASSSVILDEYEKQLNILQEQSEEFEAKMENFRNRSADVSRCWAKYGLLLLSVSRERLLDSSDEMTKISDLTLHLSDLKLDEITASQIDFNDLTFTSLKTTFYESQITDQYILTLQDAHKVFYNTQTWLDKAHSYYTLNALASDYIDILLDKSQLYKNLLFFDDNMENQSKMQKRRADLLEKVLKEVNPIYYMQYCRQMWFELGEIYCGILDIKMEKIRECKGRPSAHALNKINHLVEKSIQHYTSFTDSFKEVTSQDLSKCVDKDLQKPFLQALFHIAALWSRFITLDKKVGLENINKSNEFYKKVIDYCEANPEVGQAISAELSVCKEMVNLLPVKIMKLQQEIP
ncbi:protein KBP homolog [Agrilus planipennis]|uniref:KIF-binding protein n=1 Tax=Agrilus planipennis TaxID=224129 RepID=A0A1W4XG38_AGRPL|nr:protein KBP homolog [Agrilus planipennis]